MDGGRNLCERGAASSLHTRTHAHTQADPCPPRAVRRPSQPASIQHPASPWQRKVVADGASSFSSFVSTSRGKRSGSCTNTAVQCSAPQRTAWPACACVYVYACVCVFLWWAFEFESTPALTWPRLYIVEVLTFGWYPLLSFPPPGRDSWPPPYNIQPTPAPQLFLSLSSSSASFSIPKSAFLPPVPLLFLFPSSKEPVSYYSNILVSNLPSTTISSCTPSPSCWSA